MALLQRYDPPAYLRDFDAIPGQLEAWDAYLRECFDAEIAGLKTALQDANGRSLGMPQFYSATDFCPPATIEQDVVWNAFPKELLRRYGRAKAMVLADQRWPLAAYQLDWRYTPGEPLPDADVFEQLGVTLPRDWSYPPTAEYCEWRAERCEVTNRLRRVTFTSEPPEYWFAMFGGTLPDSEIIFPGSQQLVLQRYRELVDPRVSLKDLQVQAPFRCGLGQLVVGDYNPNNKWNTSYGIAHLCAPPNALSAEIELAALATKLFANARNEPVSTPEVLVACGALGGANRNSDPTISAAVNVLARLGRLVTLANPVGLYMDHIDLAGWQMPGKLQAQDCVKVVRGGGRMIERLVVEMPDLEFDLGDIRIGGEPLVYGGQIAECITVKLTAVASLGAFARNECLPLVRPAFVMPDAGREIFVEKHNPRPKGVVPAFVGDVGEELQASADSPGRQGPTSGGARA